MANIDDRVDALLRRIAKGAERRDQILEAVSNTITDVGSFFACVDELRTVTQRMLPSFLDSGANIARTVSVSAALAEKKFSCVKRLDVLLRRVREAKTIADSLQEMHRTVLLVSETIEKGDLERTVELIRSYEEATERLGVSAHLFSFSGDGKDGKNIAKRSEGCDYIENTNASSNVLDVKTNEMAQKEGQLEEKKNNEPPKTFPSFKAGGMTNSNNGDTKNGDVAGDNCFSKVNDVIRQARDTARKKLMAQFSQASRENDKTTIMYTARLITRLGFREEGCRIYCTWMCEHTIVALKKMVECELRKMDTPNEAAMSHLVLVSTALDIVVAAFEGEEKFMCDTFGSAKVLTLLKELHDKSTAQCVPILKNFLEKRREALRPVTLATGSSVMDTAGGGAGGRGKCKQSSENNNNNTSSGSSNGGGGVVFPASLHMSTTTTTTATTKVANALPADPRCIDQILEEMSHLVSCCHLYFTFVESKQQQYIKEIEESKMKQREKEEQQTQLKKECVVSVDSFLSSRDNPLMNIVQEILAVFVPLQKMYFEAAFEQVLRLQIEALRAAGKDALLSSVDRGGGGGGGGGNLNSGDSISRSGEKNTSPFTKKQATFMTGLAALYASTTASGGGGGIGLDDGCVEDEIEQEKVYQNLSITLPDDTFFFLRIALHRAVNTKSTQIISAVFIDCIELLQLRMIPVLRRQTTLPSAAQLSQLQQRRPGHTVPLRVLRWTSAAQCTTAYAHKLADELRQLARANFAGNDLLRFTEQAEDMDVVSRDLLASVAEWIMRFSDVCYQVYFAPHFERFSTLSYNITEEVFYHYELSDPWVRACVATADVVLQPFDEHLDSASFDKLVVKLVQRVVGVMWRLLQQKKFSAYGALQMDREVRTLRAFFIGRAHEVQLRESFLPLSCAASLLLLDTPADAEHDVYEGLSAEEKKSVLMCRIDFKPADIAKLKL